MELHLGFGYILAVLLFEMLRILNSIQGDTKVCTICIYAALYIKCGNTNRKLHSFLCYRFFLNYNFCLNEGTQTGNFNKNVNSKFNYFNRNEHYEVS